VSILNRLMKVGVCELAKMTCEESGENNPLVVVRREVDTTAGSVRVQIHVGFAHHAVHLMGFARPSSQHGRVALVTTSHSNLQAQESWESAWKDYPGHPKHSGHPFQV